MPTVRYQADNELVHLMTLDADRIAVAGTPPATGTVSNIRAKVSKSNKEYGLRPRGVRLARTVGTAPDTFVKYSFLPVLSIADFASADFQLGGSITIGTISWEIIARISEDY